MIDHSQAEEGVGGGRKSSQKRKKCITPAEITYIRNWMGGRVGRVKEKYVHSDM